MTPVTHILLIVSYAILALAVAIIPAEVGHLAPANANLLGVVIFFLALHGHTWVSLQRRYSNKDERLDKLEDKAVFLRSDLEKTRRVVDGQVKRSATKDGLVSELKVLQTLIGQVVKKEQERAEKAKHHEVSADTTDARSEKEDMEDQVMPDQEQADDTTLDLEDDQSVHEGEHSNDLYLTSETRGIEDAEKYPNSKTAAAKGSSSGSLIRVVGDEEQLFSLIRNSLSENRVDLYVQPIMGLPGRTIAHYECLSRVRDEDGNIVLPRQYLRLAEDEGLIGTIDNLLLFRLIQLARRLGPRKPNVRFFCNISKYSMMDQEFFPQFVDFMMNHEEFTNRFVFEMGQNDYESLDARVKDQLASLGRRGFGFSMDHIHSLDLDLSEMGKHHFRYVKIDAVPLLRESGVDIKALKADLRRHGMELISSRMEGPDLVAEAIDAGVELAQGYHFGEPVPAQTVNRDLL